MARSALAMLDCRSVEMARMHLAEVAREIEIAAGDTIYNAVDLGEKHLSHYRNSHRETPREVIQAGLRATVRTMLW
jgi:hypothetical protein